MSSTDHSTARGGVSGGDANNTDQGESDRETKQAIRDEVKEVNDTHQNSTPDRDSGTSPNKP
jgi:hypothetical protein